ncbi:MAG: alanyl-tRNA editing protein [Treponema sp.]|jgi:alanyl-tRNA synthetase|nr:alanyl-tRNA editing protein [Treponema sp.]
MQTERLYYEYFSVNPYNAEIREIRHIGEQEAALVLDRSIFYPEGGGQSADRGSIQGAALLDVREEGEEILHIVNAEDARRLKPGPAECLLDLRRRRDYTVCHTAQHLLSGTILRIAGKATVSMRLGEETCTIDVDSPVLSGEILLAAEDAVMDAIEENHSVIIHLCPPEDISRFPLRKAPPGGEDAIRVVEIEGNDFSPCCGTHCASTGQIGMLRILGAEKYKGMTRVSFIAGRRCLEESRLLRKNALTVSRAFRAPLHETGEAALIQLEKSARLERRLSELEEIVAENEAVLLAAGADRSGTAMIVKSYGDKGMEELLRIGRAAQKKNGSFYVLASETDLKFAAFTRDKGRDLKALFGKKMESLGGRGGGGNGFFQGLFENNSSLAAFMESLQEGKTE